MNGKRAKKIRKLSDALLLVWLNNNLPRDATQVTLQNLRSYLPKDKYFIGPEGNRCNNFYTSKWAINKIKKHLKKKDSLSELSVDIL